jgi:sugar O-acyltransferase (sialic acid O-acetyltransferase NeuD family)
MIIAGAGNLGIHTLDQLIGDHYDGEIFFFDDNEHLPGMIKDKYPLIRTLNELSEHCKKFDPSFVVALGQPRFRERLHKRILQAGGQPATIISSKVTFLSNFCSIGAACIIQPGCAISHHANIGNSVVLHAGTLLGHDLSIGDFVTIGSNCNILKGVQIGQYSTISPNVLVYQNVRIGNNAYIAPGVILTKDVEDNQTVTL